MNVLNVFTREHEDLSLLRCLGVAAACAPLGTHCFSGCGARGADALQQDRGGRHRYYARKRTHLTKMRPFELARLENQIKNERKILLCG